MSRQHRQQMKGVPLMFQHILVPLDGSSLAEQALPLAAHLAQVSGGTITLLHITNPAVEYGPYLAQPYTYMQDVVDTDLANAAHYLEGIARSEVLKDMRVQKEALSGEIARSILDFAHKHATDIVVMCSHGRTGFQRWALGSIAQKVARYSTKPVLIVKNGHTTLPATNATPRPISVLVALDGSPLAETALLPAAQLCASLNTPNQGTLHLIRVVELIPSVRSEATATINEMNEQTVAQARTYLQNVEQRLRGGDLAMFHLSVTSSIATGYDTADILVREAEQGKCCDNGTEYEGCDIIALATHGRGGLQRWVMGSVAERVLSSTKLPLLIIRSTEAKASPSH